MEYDASMMHVVIYLHSWNTAHNILLGGKPTQSICSRIHFGPVEYIHM